MGFSVVEQFFHEGFRPFLSKILCRWKIAKEILISLWVKLGEAEILTTKEFDVVHKPRQ